MQAALARHSCRLGVVGLGIGLSSLAAFVAEPPRAAVAACNAIPAADVTDFYFSVDNPASPTTITGKIDSRLVAPGQRVTVAVDMCVTGSTPFDSSKINSYQLKLEFRDFTTGSNVALPAMSLVNPATCANPNCESLSFEFPDTKDPVTRAKGLAGPVTLTILDGVQVLAKIESLYLPSNACPNPATDLARDTVFKSLIALPSLNDFETTPANGNETDKPLLAALDESENLLIPLDFSGEKQDTAAPIATLLSGFTEIDAEFPPQGTPPKLRERLGQGQDGDRLIRVFTLDGKPLPPLRKVTNDGTLFGLVDADSSVVRLECSAVHGPSQRRVCDLKGLAPYPGAPVVFTYRSKKGIATPVPMYGLRTSEDTIAYARDEAYEDKDLDGNGRKEMTPEIIEATIGLPRPAGVPVAARPAGNFFEPILAAGKGHMSFLEPLMDASNRFIEKHRLRIFRNGGTAVGATPEASDAPRIDGSPIALSTETGGPPVSATRAFYLEPEADHDNLAAIRLSGGSDVVGKQAATKVSTAGGVAVYLAPERVVGDKNGDGDDFDSVAYFYGVRANGSACNIPLKIRRPGLTTDEAAAATDVALSEQVIVASVSEHDHFRAVLNDDGDAADDVVYMWKTSDLVANCQSGASVVGTNVLYAADAIAAWGSRAVWVAPESAQKTGLPRCQPTTPAGGCDLNKDKDSNDRVLMSATRSGATTDIVSSAVATADFELGDPSSGIIAIRVPEASQRESLNEDGDWNDSVLHAYRPGCWQAALNSGWSALPCTFASCDPRRPYRVDDDTVWFLTDQQQPEPIALATFVVPRCNPGFPPFVPNSRPPFMIPIRPWWPLIRTQFLGEDLLMLAGHENLESERPGPVLVAGDADHDGVLDPFDNCAEFPNADRLDADGDGIGDRYCDPTPAACPPRPRANCLGDDDVVSPAGLCFAQTADQLEFAWSWPGASHSRPVNPGDPIHGQPHYSVCVYPKESADRPVVAAAALPWPECGDPPCWRGDVERGFVLSGDGKLPRNLDTLVLPGTAAHASTLYAKGTVPRKGLLAFALDRPTTVQLTLQVDGKPVQCWSSTHQPAQTLAACPNPADHVAPATSPAARAAPLLPTPQPQRK